MFKQSKHGYNVKRTKVAKIRTKAENLEFLNLGLRSAFPVHKIDAVGVSKYGVNVGGVKMPSVFSNIRYKNR